MGTPELFAILHAANADGSLYGAKPISAFGSLCQLWHETGGFSSGAMMRHWNLAGIKCTSSWIARGGDCFDGETSEFVLGTELRGVRAFRSYPALSAFLSDYSRLIQTYYPFAAESPDCVWLFFAGLVAGPRKWATDPLYFNKLARAALRLAPDLLGPTWEETLARSLAVADERGWPQSGVKAVAHGLLHR